MVLTERDKVEVREDAGRGPIQDFLAASAQRYRIWLAGGSVPLVSSDPKKIRSACLLYDDAGRCAAYVEQSLAMITVLAPRIGYDAAAAISFRGMQYRKDIGKKP